MTMVTENVDDGLAWHRFSQLKLALSLYQCPPWQLAAEQQQAFAKQVTRQIILETRLVQQAIERHEKVTGEQCQLTQLGLSNQFGEGFSDLLQQARLSDTELRQAIEHEVLLNRQLAWIDSQAPQVSDEEVYDWYEQHQEAFFRPEQRQTRHLLLIIDEEQEGCDRDSVTQLMAQIVARLQEDKQSFAQVPLKVDCSAG